MKWFDKWFSKKVKQAWDDARTQPEEVISSNRVRLSSEPDLPDGGLSIQVKSAIGGKVVIFRQYDQRKDQNSYTTYIITNDENFSESLGKIITTESLKL